MYIRIPTGHKTLTLSAKQKRLIEYKCSKCGKTHLYEFVIETKQSAEYHVLSGEKGRVQAEQNARKLVVEDFKNRIVSCLT